jgi:translocator protein
MHLNDGTKLVVSLLACFAAGGIGSLFTFRAIPAWYAGLRKPRFTPPNWAFGPVWTTLYVLMAVSVFLVWRGGLDTGAATLAFVLFWIQLGLNALWSIIFFGLKSKAGGLAVIAVLWALILASMLAAFRVSTWAGALLVSYLAWVTLATYLNAGVWWLNRASGLVSPE